MYQLKQDKDSCNGKRSCGICNDILEVFATEHSSDILISKTDRKANAKQIDYVLDACPVGALSLCEFSE